MLLTLMAILLLAAPTADLHACSLPGDMNDDGVVDVIDVQSVAAQWGATCQPAPAPDMTARVVWVIDGDTVILEGGEHLRYLGIDAPEIGDSPECYGQEALWANIDLVENKTLSLYFDRQQRDRYGRLLAYAYLPDGDFVNRWLIRQGYATTWIISPNTAQGHTILDAETCPERRPEAPPEPVEGPVEGPRRRDEARAAGRGLWSACADE
jgi:endonuclease YncB( thermonuclease family)